MTPNTPSPITSCHQEPHFRHQIIAQSGVDVGLCWHCKSCSGGCPFSWAMDYHPHQVLRLVQLGLKSEALQCATIWICVGCHTCSTACPMAIDMAAVMDALRQTALREGQAAPEPDIVQFHQEVLNSIERYGRTHKMEIMFRYKLKKRDWLADMDVGLKMLFKRKLHLMPSKVKDARQIRGLFSPSQSEAA